MEGGQRHALAALHPGKIPGAHCTGGWVGAKAGQGEKYRYHRDSIPEPSRP